MNPLVKLTVKESYYECADENNNKNICSEVKDEIVNLDLLNEDAKSIYSNVNINGKSSIEAVVMLCDIAKDNNIVFENLEITATSKNVFTVSELQKMLNDKSKYDVDYSVVVNFKTKVNENNLINNLKVATFTIKFDTDGGSVIEEQFIDENETVTLPEAPKKEGYTFVEWQLDGVVYDFETLVTKDMLLKAVWKQNEVVQEQNNVIEEQQSVTPPVEEEPPVEVPPVEEEQPDVPPVVEPPAPVVESTINKINLNENIMVNVGIVFLNEYYFATNVETVFAGMVNGNRVELFNFPISYEEIQNRMSQLTFDANKEQQAITALNSVINAPKQPGVGNDYFDFEFNYNKHSFSFEFSYLSVDYQNSSKFANLSSGLENSKNNTYNSFMNALSGGYHIIIGGMGFGPPEPMLLDENLCIYYNLNCARW